MEMEGGCFGRWGNCQGNSGKTMWEVGSKSTNDNGTNTIYVEYIGIHGHLTHNTP